MEPKFFLELLYLLGENVLVTHIHEDDFDKKKGRAFHDFILIFEKIRLFVQQTLVEWIFFQVILVLGDSRLDDKK